MLNMFDFIAAAAIGGLVGVVAGYVISGIAIFAITLVRLSMRTRQPAPQKQLDPALEYLINKRMKRDS